MSPPTVPPRLSRNMTTIVFFMPIVNFGKKSYRKILESYERLKYPLLAYEICWSEYTPEVETCMREVIAGGSKLWVNSPVALPERRALRRCRGRGRPAECTETGRYGRHHDPDRPPRTADLPTSARADCTTDAMSRITEFLPHQSCGSCPGAGRSIARQVLPPPAPAGIRRRNARIQPLLRLPHQSQRHEETHSRQRVPGRIAVGSHRLGTLFAYAIGKVRQRIHRRLLQHQALHGHGTHRLGRGQRP